MKIEGKKKPTKKNQQGEGKAENKSEECLNAKENGNQFLQDRRKLQRKMRSKIWSKKSP